MADVFVLIGALTLLLVHAETAVIVIKLIDIVIILLYYAWSYAGLFETRIMARGFQKGFACGLPGLMIEFLILSLLIMTQHYFIVALSF